MKAHLLFKQNIKTLLRARGQTPHDLAFYCRRTDAWISKILGKDDRNVPMKYLDRIADFFGLATYQLFQPGISPLTERRQGTERRSGADRRISARNRALPTTPLRQIEVTPEDEALLAELKTLTYEEVQRVRHWMSVVRLGRRSGPETAAPPDQPLRVVPSTTRVPRTRAGRLEKRK